MSTPTLEDEHQQLNHAESILSALQSAIDICKDNDQQNIQAALAQAQALLENMPYRSASMHICVRTAKHRLNPG